jgi:hypothetical protein
MRAIWKSLPTRALCLYPGLPQLWHEGTWWALALAVGFAVTLNLALLSSFVWSELLSTWGVALSWAVTTILEGLGVWLSVRQGYWRVNVEPGESLPDVFPAAQVEYLRGNWYQAEALCRQLLKRDDHDAEAHLMMVGVLRRTDRMRDARRQLQLLASLETADRWEYEIGLEWARLDETVADGKTGTTANLAVADPGESEPPLRQAA